VGIILFLKKMTWHEVDLFNNKEVGGGVIKILF